MDEFPGKAELEEQERRLRFDSFGLEDAYRLGRGLYEAGRASGETFAVRVKLGDLIAFQALMPGTGAANVEWMDRKTATVERTGHSSLWAFVDRKEGGLATEPLEGDGRYALFGGGFPLVAERGPVGVAAISGLPHLDDHRRLVSVLEKAFATSLKG